MDAKTEEKTAPVTFEGYELPPFMTVDDVQALLGGVVRRRTVVRWCQRGLLRATKAGKAWVIRASQLVEDWQNLERGAPAVRQARATGALAGPVRSRLVRVGEVDR